MCIFVVYKKEIAMTNSKVDLDIFKDLTKGMKISDKMHKAIDNLLENGLEFHSFQESGVSQSTYIEMYYENPNDENECCFVEIRFSDHDSVRISNHDYNWEFSWTDEMNVNKVMNFIKDNV